MATSPTTASMISNTTISENHVAASGRYGIYVLADFLAGGDSTTISGTTISRNEVSENLAIGIGAATFAGNAHRISGLTISENNVHDNGAVAINLASGVCGATGNVLDAVITGNSVANNGQTDQSPGIVIVGGSGFACPNAPAPATDYNQLTANIHDNTLTGNPGGNILVIGGQVGAHHNAVTATVSSNTSTGGLTGITVIGGAGLIGPESRLASSNAVHATLSGNRIAGAVGGILLTAGSAGPASDNAIDAIVDHNVACGSTLSDISCVGGFPGTVGFPSNQGTGNVVSGVVQDNVATTVISNPGIAGNSCAAQIQRNVACNACAGDCNADREVTVDELVALVNVALGNSGVELCVAGDGDRDGHITIDEIVTAVNHALSGC